MSAMHTHHPPGLHDDCPRCAEQAEDPFGTLDNENLVALVNLALDRDRLSRGRSETELVAAATVLTALERAGRLAETHPGGVERYLRERWHLRVRIEGHA